MPTTRSRTAIVCPFCSNSFFPRWGQTWCSRECADFARKAFNIERFPEHFWARVDKFGDCWPWMGARDRHGYGQVHSPFVGHHCTASRVAYELAHGTIPGGLDVLHRCDNPPCVRPEHLFLGTHAVNLADMAAKGRHYSVTRPGLVPRGEQHGNARLTADAVREIRRTYTDGEGTHLTLARRFGVSEATIQHLLSGRTWGHL